MATTPDFKERLNKITLRNSKVRHIRHKTWPIEKKIEVVSQFLVLGNMRMVAATTGVSHDLIRQWKGQPWWKELEAEIRQTQNIEMDSKLSKIVDKSLDAVLDRVENGEYFYDQKAGKIKRKPVNLRDVARVSVDMLSKRELLRGNATERKEVTQVSVQDQLKMLAAEFAKWQNPKAQEVIDVDVTDVTPHEPRDFLGVEVEMVEVIDVKDQGDQEGEVVEGDEFTSEVHDSDEQGRLGPPDEGEPTTGPLD